MEVKSVESYYVYITTMKTANRKMVFQHEIEQKQYSYINKNTNNNISAMEVPQRTIIPTVEVF